MNSLLNLVENISTESAVNNQVETEVVKECILKENQTFEILTKK